MLDRVGFIHGRIASSGCIQVKVNAEANRQRDNVNQFKQMWTACFAAFHRNAKNGDIIVFTPVLLESMIHYARTIPGVDGEIEESDRWEQTLLLRDMAESCYHEALENVRINSA